MVHIKEPLLLIGKSSPCSGGSRFLSHYLNGTLPYVRCHITINKNVLSASLSKTFPSFVACLSRFVKTQSFVRLKLCIANISLFTVLFLRHSLFLISAVGRLARNDANKRLLVEEGCLPLLAQLALSDDPDEQKGIKTKNETGNK